MANIIKTKFSAVTAQPTSLAVGELAYSDQSDTLWIGDNTGTPVAIGGAAAFTKLAGIAAGAEVNTVTSVAGKTGVVTLVIADTAGLQTALDDKTNIGHAHVIANVTGLQAALDGKANSVHGHVIADVTGLQAAIDLKANTSALASLAPLASPTFTGTVTVPTPTASTSAATKQYVDDMALGLDFKQSVRVSSVANINLSAAVATIDGVTMVAGDRVLVKDQTAPAENGIYIQPSSGAYVRSVDADTSSEVTRGLFVFVESGTLAGNAYVVTAAGTLGTDAVEFTQFGGGGGSFTAGTGITLTGSAFSVTNYANIVFDTDTIDGGTF